MASAPADRLGAPTLLGIAGAALVVQVLYCLLAMRGYHPVSDSAHYSDIALKITQGKGIASQFPYAWTHPTAFRPPLFPVLLSGAYAVFGVHIAVAQGLNVVLGTGVVVLTALLAFRLGGRTAALVAAAVAALHPALLANAGAILSEPLALLLMLAALLLLDSQRFLLAGIAAGLLVLTRPSAQLYVPVVAVYLVVAAVRRARRSDRTPGRLLAGIGSALVFCLMAVVTVAPWVIRNQIEFGKPVIVTSNGFNLAAIYSPLALQRGRFTDPVRDPAYQGTRFANWENFNEAVLDANLRKEGLDGLRSHKHLVPKIVGNNVLYLFDGHWRRNDRPEQLDGRNIGFRHATLPYVWAVLVLGGVGLVSSRRRSLGALVIVSAVYVIAVSVITVSPPRLRAPVDVLCCVGVGVLAAAWQRRRTVEPPDEATGSNEPTVLAEAGRG